MFPIRETQVEPELFKPFPPELRTAAFVSRWNIIWSNLRDNVAQHSFFVAWYALMIAQVIKWDGPRDYLMMAALAHDLDETITADITGPVKNMIMDKDKAEDYLHMRMEQRMGSLIGTFYNVEDGAADHVYDAVHKIVDAADIMDAVFYLQVNINMGNKVVLPTFEVGLKKLEGAWRALPAPEALLSRTWQTVVMPAIAEHRMDGGRGV